MLNVLLSNFTNLLILYNIIIVSGNYFSFHFWNVWKIVRKLRLNYCLWLYTVELQNLVQEMYQVVYVVKYIYIISSVYRRLFFIVHVFTLWKVIIALRNEQIYEYWLRKIVQKFYIFFFLFLEDIVYLQVVLFCKVVQICINRKCCLNN